MNHNINSNRPGREGGYRGNMPQRPSKGGGQNGRYQSPSHSSGRGGRNGGRGYTGGSGENQPYRGDNRAQKRGQASGTPRNTSSGGARRSAYPRGYAPVSGGGGNDGIKLIFILLITAVIITGIIVAIVKSKDARPAYSGDTGNGDTLATTSAETAEAPAPGATSGLHYAIEDENTVQLSGHVSSEYMIMIDPEEGRIIAQKNPDEMIYPASMTKIMTLIVAYENCQNLDDTFVLTTDITDPLFLAGASTAGFEVGQAISIRDLLYGAALPSGGDATDALAIYTAGSMEAFADMMNKKALSLGLSNTHFVNASGLHDDNHYSTAHEIALILEYALDIPYLREIMSSRTYTAKATNQQNPGGIPMFNTMFSRLGEYADTKTATIIAGKTGYTNEGLNCLASVGMLKSTGKEYIVVAAKAPGKNDAAIDTANLYTLLFGSEG